MKTITFVFKYNNRMLTITHLKTKPSYLKAQIDPNSKIRLPRRGKDFKP